MRHVRPTLLGKQAKAQDRPIKEFAQCLSIVTAFAPLPPR